MRTQFCGLGLNLATAMSLEGPKKLTSDRSSTAKVLPSTDSANLVKIGPIDVEIIGLTEIVKKEKKPLQNMSPVHLRLHFLQPWWANYSGRHADATTSAILNIS